MGEGFPVMPAVSQNLTADLRERLQAHLDGLKERKIGDRHQFIPRKLLRQLFTLENLTAYLERHQPEVAEREKLASYIRDAAQQTFAILLLIDEPVRIHALKTAFPKDSTSKGGIKQPGIDEALFRGQNDGARSYCSKQRLEQTTQLGDIAERFDATQYLFPPFLSTTDTPEYDPMRFVFPFEYPVKDKIGEGSFGVVWEVNIEHDYIEYSEDDPTTTVACKILKPSEKRPDWNMLKREVNVVKARQHLHVTPIYASFMACRTIQEDRDGVQRLYIVMPLAIMDMKAWMKRKPDDIEFSPDNIKEHIWSTILGLSSALTYIHREIGGKVGYHGDIKPSNILLFKASSGYIWKLSDFGSANLKQHDDTATASIQASPRWAPEEFQDGQKHGRIGDIWSLGCVFLHLVTMLLYGWDEQGLKKFERQLEGEPFHTDNQSLQRWIRHLEKEALKQDTDVGKLVLLVQDMLRAQKFRPFSWEIDIELYCIRNPKALDEDIEEHLKSVIQQPRDIDHEIDHKPMERAKRLGRGPRYLQLLGERGWSQDENSGRQQITAANTISPFHVPKSTIPARPDLIAKLTRALDEKRMVVLYGLRGIGKNTLALQYYLERFGHDKVKFIKVNAKSELSIKESYDTIAARYHPQNPTYSDETSRRDRIKEWLKDSDTGPWYMHISGLEQEKVAIALLGYLPVLNSNSKGMIVITTRDRALSEVFVGLRGDNDIHIDRPNERESLEIFRQTVNEGFLGAEDDYKKFLEILGSPGLMYKTALHMNRRQTTCYDMLYDIEHVGLRLIEDIQKDLASYYLVPILVKRIGVDDEWPEQLQQIFLLSMFDNGIGVDDRLIFSEREGADIFDGKTALDRLANCFLIQKKANRRSPTRYYVDSAVQLAVLAWIEKNERVIGFLRRFNKALSILDTCYAKSKRSSDSYTRERTFQEYVQHFEHIVRYSKMQTFSTAHKAEQFNFNDSAIQAIMTFCNALWKKGDTENAEHMLDLGQSHYSLESIIARSDPTMRQDGAEIFTTLNRHVVNLKIALHRSDEYQMKDLEGQVTELRQKANIAGNALPPSGKLRLYWQFHILWARVLRVRKRYEEVRREYPNLMDIRFAVSGNQATLPKQLAIKCEGSELEKLRSLVINARVEEGLLDLDEGNSYLEKNNEDRARKVWANAHQSFLDTQIAAVCWRSSTLPEPQNLELYTAETSLQVGNQQELEKAMRFYDREHKNLLKKPKIDDVEVWEMEYKLNCAKWKLGGIHKSEARTSLEALRPKFEETFGMEDPRTKRLIARLHTDTPSTSQNQTTERVDQPAGDHQAQGNSHSDLGSRRDRLKQVLKEMWNPP